MRKVKPDSSSDTASQRMRPAITPEARQKQMISLATDCAEDLMRSGKAPSQIIVHYLKLGTKQAELEIKRAEKDLALRGPGDMNGLKQSGMPNFAFANIISDFKMFEIARNDATYILNNASNGEFKSIIQKAKELADMNKFRNV